MCAEQGKHLSFLDPGLMIAGIGLKEGKF
jgi:hypothetical protein